MDKSIREIFFRGFSPNEHGTKTITVNGEKVRGDWVEGFFRIRPNMFSVTGKNRYCIQTFKILESGEIIWTGCFDVIPETVCQYTGLNKQDIKMWEHDRVKGKLTITANEEPYSYKRKIKEEREVFGTIVFKDGVYTIDWDAESCVFDFYKKPLYYYTYNATIGDRHNATIPEQYDERSEISEIEIIGNKWEDKE